MNSTEHAKLAHAVVDRWSSHRGKPATERASLVALPMLSEIYALADGGEDSRLFNFHAIEEQRREAVHLPGEDAPREVLVFADFMINSHEYFVDVATGEVFVVGITPYVVAPSLEAFFELYVAGSRLV